MDQTEAAVQYIKSHQKEIVHKFACKDEYPPVLIPSSYFMAGSPGAGKTEWSKSFIKTLIEKEPDRKVVRIDPDEIRESIEGYIPEKAALFQRATGLGVQKVMDQVLHNNQDFLLDGTFSHYELSHKNIDRSLQKNRKVGVLYIYQDPLVAWNFTKIRSVIERRIIPKDAFITGFFNAKENVNKVKEVFGKKVQVWLVIKNGLQEVDKVHFNIDRIDNYLKMDYNAQTLAQELL